jgi:hypothetical protein
MEVQKVFKQVKMLQFPHQSHPEEIALVVGSQIIDNFDPITEDSLCCWLPAGGDCLLLEGCSILGCPRCDESH